MGKDSTFRVADIMKAAVKTVPPDMTLADLETELVDAQVSGFPVVDQGKLVGVVSRSDVVRTICDERDIAEHTSDFYFDDTGFHEVPMESLSDIAQRVGQRLESLVVRDVMVARPFTVRLDQPIEELAQRLIKQHIHRCPVVDGADLVGIVTTLDLVKLIADRRLTP